MAAVVESRDPGAEPVPAPRIRAFERLGFGMFVHWGLYSQLQRGEWVWTHHRMKAKDYLPLFKGFTAADFDATALVRQAKRAGCRYVVLTTRHHEGFSLYDTRGLNAFDAPHSPAGRDLVAEFSAACEAEGMGKFFYHTTLDWWHKDFDAPGRWNAYLDYLNRSVEILCTRYGKVDGLWFDGNWARKGRDWKEDALYRLIRRRQPEAIIVNNSSTGALGAECHPEVDIRTFEQGRPTRPDRRGKAKYTAIEMCDTIHSHWGISTEDFSQQAPGAIIEKLALCRKVGGNYLLNVGPTPTGAIPAYDAALLDIVGRWTAINGEALYDAEPTGLQCQGQDFVLRKGKVHYYFAHHLEINENVHLHSGDGAGPKAVLGALPPVKRVSWLDNGEELAFAQAKAPALKPVAGRQHRPAESLFTFRATRWPYGRNQVVRVARIET
jgi:alpha-L-fucosidase